MCSENILSSPELKKKLKYLFSWFNNYPFKKYVVGLLLVVFDTPGNTQCSGLILQARYLGITIGNG